MTTSPNLPINRPRVLISCFAPIPSGFGVSEIILERLAPLAHQFEVEVLCLRSEGYPHIESFHGARVYRVSVPRDNVVEAMQQFRRSARRLLETGQYQIVHTFDPFTGLEALKLQQALGLRIVYELTTLVAWQLRHAANYFHMGLDAAPSWLASLETVEKNLVARCDAVLTASNALRGAVVQWGTPSQAVRTITGGVPKHRYRQGSDESPTRVGPSQVFYLGRVAPWLDLDTLLAGFARSEVASTARLVFLGPHAGAETEQLLERAGRFGVAAQLDVAPITGWVEARHALMRATVGVLPVRSVEQAAGPFESEFDRGLLPRKIFDYMASAVPTIATDTLSVADVMGPHRAGAWLVPPGDVNAWAHAIDRLVNDTGERRRIGDTGHARHATQYSAETSIEAVSRTYNELLGLRPATHGEETTKVMGAPVGPSADPITSVTITAITATEPAYESAPGSP